MKSQAHCSAIDLKDQAGSRLFVEAQQIPHTLLQILLQYFDDRIYKQQIRLQQIRLQQISLKHCSRNKPQRHGRGRERNSLSSFGF